MSKTKILDPGTEVPLGSFDGRLYECSPLLTTHLAKNAVSAKKRHLAVTKSNIIELAPHPFKRQFATVLEVHKLDDLSRVKFKRGEQISFCFKNDRVVNYRMTEAAECVEFVKSQMMKLGIKGQQSIVKTTKNVFTAEGIFERIKEVEEKFSISPSYTLVEQVMDLLREAAERFGEANDARYQHAIQQTQRFLQRDDVIRTLDLKRAEAANEKSIESKNKTVSTHSTNGKINTTVPPMSDIERELEQRLQSAVQLAVDEDLYVEREGEMDDPSGTPATEDSILNSSEILERELLSELREWTSELNDIMQGFTDKDSHNAVNAQGDISAELNYNLDDSIPHDDPDPDGYDEDLGIVFEDLVS